MRIKLFFLFFVASLFSVNAQVTEFGFHFGYNTSKLKVDQNRLTPNTAIRIGRLGGGPTLGAQLIVGPPKKQSSTKIKIIPSVLFETSISRIRNEVTLAVENSNGTSSLIAVDYLFYRGDYSGKFVASIKRIQFMIGPTISTIFYAGANIGGSEGLQYAGDHFKTVVAGYEIGVGKKFNAFMISARYHGLLERFGEKSILIPTEYKNNQFRFMVGYFFMRKERGGYWDSIYGK